MNTRTPVVIMIPLEDSRGLLENCVRERMIDKAHVGTILFRSFNRGIISHPAYMMADDEDTRKFKDSVEDLIKFTIVIDSNGVGGEEYSVERLKQLKWSGNVGEIEIGEYALEFGDNRVRLTDK